MLLFCARLSFGQTLVVDSLQRAVSFAKEDSSKVWLLLSLSDAHKPIDRQKAMEYADSAKVLSEGRNYIRGAAFSQRAIGLLLREKREYEQASVRCREAEKLFRYSNNAFEVAETYVEHARSLIPFGRKEAALDTLYAAKALYRSLVASPDTSIARRAKKGILNTFHFTWYAHYVAGESLKGLEVLKEYEQTALGNNRQDPLPNLYNNCGAAHRQMGEDDKALEYYFKGLAIAEELNAWEDQQRLHNNIAVLYSARSEYGNTREHLLQALLILATYQKHDTRGLAHKYGNLAGTETKLGQYADALEHYLMALKLFEEHSNTLELADFLVEFSEYYSLQSDYRNAMAHLNRALGYYRQINNNTGVSHVLFQLGKIATAQQHLDKALEYHTQSLDIRKRGDEKLYVSLSMCETGNVLLLMARTAVKTDSLASASVHSLIDSAASLFRQGLEISRTISDESTMQSCFFGLGRAEMLRSNWARAARYAECSADVLQSGRSRSMLIVGDVTLRHCPREMLRCAQGDVSLPCILTLRSLISFDWASS